MIAIDSTLTRFLPKPQVGARTTARDARGPLTARRAPSIVPWQPFNMPEVFHRLEDFQHLGEEVRSDWLFNPAGPFADVVRGGAAGDGRGDVGVGAGELQGRVRGIDSLLHAMLCGFSRGGPQQLPVLV